MKENIIINVGKETTDKEIEIIKSIFSEYYSVSIQRSIIRLSADTLPLIIDFTIAAITSGVFYDVVKYTLILLQDKLNNELSKRKGFAKIKHKEETFILSQNKISKQNIKTKH